MRRPPQILAAPASAISTGRKMMPQIVEPKGFDARDLGHWRSNAGRGHSYLST